MVDNSSRCQNLYQEAKQALSKSVGFDNEKFLELTEILEELRGYQKELEAKNAKLDRALLNAESSNQKLSTVLNSIPLGILVIDRLGVVMEANDFSKEVFSSELLTPLIGSSLYRLLHERDAQKISRTIKFDKKQKSNLGLIQFNVDDQEMIFETLGVPLPQSYNLDGHFMIIMIDRTKEADSTMESKDLLDLKHDYENQLIKANIELKRSNDELQQFACIASHDLQEPLRIVTSFTDLLYKNYRSKLDEKGLRYLEFTHEGSQRMQVMIENLLAYSKIKTTFEDPESIESAQALAAAMSNLKVLIEEVKAIISYSDLPSVKANKLLLMQLFQNLLSNAIKYRSDYPPIVNVTAQTNGQIVHFRITDNGIGVKDEHRELIFHPLRRFTELPEKPGTGMGLAICQRIVELHGGKIWVESNFAGLGSTFNFTLSNQQI